MNDEPPIELASRCMRVSRAVSIHLYDPPTLEMVTIRYFDAVFCSLTGKKGAWGECGVPSSFLPLSLQLK